MLPGGALTVTLPSPRKSSGATLTRVRGVMRPNGRASQFRYLLSQSENGEARVGDRRQNTRIYAYLLGSPNGV